MKQILDFYHFNEKYSSAGYYYNSELDEVISYILDKKSNILEDIISFILRKKMTTFEVPKNLTRNISFIKELKIKIVINDCEYSNGAAEVDNEVDLVDDKLSRAIIYIELSRNEKSRKQKLYSILYHEVNHLFEIYKDLLKNDNIDRFSKVAKRSVDDLIVFGNEQLDEAFTNLIYRLFSETEINAMISGLYGELRSGAKLEDTDAYIVWNDIKKYYSDLLDLINPNI